MDHELILERVIKGANSTLGELSLDGTFLCHTLEDVVRTGPKVEGATAIPAGTYQVIVNFSNRFQRPMPLLVNVPGFEGIRIHAGNTDKDTEGCILVGVKTDNPAFISNSRVTFGAVFKAIEAALVKGKVHITVQ